MLRKKDIKSYLLKGSIGSFVIQMAGMALVFVSSFVTARLLGEEAYGVYTYILTWASLFGGMVVLGFDDLMIRVVAGYKIQKKYGSIKGILRIALGTTLGSSIIIIGIVYGLIHGDFLSECAALKEFSLYVMIQEHQAAFTLALWCIPLMGFLHIYQSALLGAKHVISGQLATGVIKPMVLLIGIGMAWFFDLFHVLSLMYVNIFAFFFATLLSWGLFRKKFQASFQQVQAVYERKKWSSEAGTFFLITSVNLINIRADILMLGALTGEEATGIYKVASSLSEILRFALGILTVVLAPLITDLYQRGKQPALQKMITKSVRIVFVGALPFAALLIGFGEWILSWYGPAFVSAYTALVILSSIQLFNLWTGVGGKLLMMTGYERPVFITLCIVTIFNIFLNAFFIPLYGEVGAALATALSVILYNVILLSASLYYLKIDPTILGFLSKQKM